MVSGVWLNVVFVVLLIVMMAIETMLWGVEPDFNVLVFVRCCDSWHGYRMHMSYHLVYT